MSSEEMFTMDDAENDGKIKREVGRKMVRNAKTNKPEMYKKFEKVCERKGVSPQEAMGQHALMALEDESHSGMLANTVVDMSGLESDAIRLEDAKFIQDLSEELGLGEEPTKDPVDKMIERRLEAKAGPIIPGADTADTGGANREVASRLENIQEEISRLKVRVDSQEAADDSGGSDGDKKDIDDLFDDGGDTDKSEGDSSDGDVGDTAGVPTSGDGEDD